MAENVNNMYAYFDKDNEKYLRVVPVTLGVITTNKDHAVGIRDGMDHTIRMLSEYYDVVMRVKPYVEQQDEEKWIARTRFALVPTIMPTGLKPRWIEIFTGVYEEKLP